MDIASAAVTSQAAQTRQNAALSVIKQAAEQSQELVRILDQATQNVAASSTRGTNVNISA